MGKVGSAVSSSGLKRTAGNHSINSSVSVSTEKRARSGGRESISSKETHSHSKVGPAVVSSGLKRAAGDLSINSVSASSEKRPRSGSRDSTSSKETHSSYFTTATHASSSVDTAPHLKNLAGTPLKTPVKKDTSSSGGVGKLYVTPTKSFIQDLAKSPKMKSSSIVDVLNRSLSQAKIVAKAACPVCNIQVPEKFLNIHLDKCLRDQETSPVIASSRSRSGSSSRSKKIPIKKVANPFLVELDDGEDENLINAADFLDQPSQDEGCSSFQGVGEKEKGSDRFTERAQESTSDGLTDLANSKRAQESTSDGLTGSIFGTEDLFCVLRPDRTAELLLGEWEGLITNLEKHIKVSSALERLEKSSNKLRSPLHEQQTNTLLAKPGKENSEPAQSYKSCQQGEEDVHWVEKNISQPHVDTLSAHFA